MLKKELKLLLQLDFFKLKAAKKPKVLSMPFAKGVCPVDIIYLHLTAANMPLDN